MFGDASELKVYLSRIQRLRLRLKDKTELCSLKPFVCSAVFFFFSLSLSHSFFFFFPVSEVVVNAFGMTQADMYVCAAVLLLLCVCERVHLLVSVRERCYSTCVRAESVG